MQKMRLTFQLNIDDQFIVTVERHPGHSNLSTETAFDDEDRFLKLLIMAGLDEQTTRRVVIAVVLAVANPEKSAKRVPVELSWDECVALNLKVPEERPFLVSSATPQTTKGFPPRVNSNPSLNTTGEVETLPMILLDEGKAADRDRLPGEVMST